MKKYYDDAKYNAAFDRCIDVMSRMVLKYGPKVLELKAKEMQNEEENKPEKKVAA